MQHFALLQHSGYFILFHVGGLQAFRVAYLGEVSKLFRDNSEMSKCSSQWKFYLRYNLKALLSYWNNCKLVVFDESCPSFKKIRTLMTFC